MCRRLEYRVACSEEMSFEQDAVRIVDVIKV